MPNGRKRMSHREGVCLPRACRPGAHVAEALVWGERHDGTFFDIFCERQAPRESRRGSCRAPFLIRPVAGLAEPIREQALTQIEGARR